MAEYLDVNAWARRELFQFFRGYDKPFFNVCARVDVTRLLALLHERSGVSVSLTCHYFALRIANEIEPFRYRLRDERVLIHEVIHGGTTVLMPNETFVFAYFKYEEDFARFIVAAHHEVEIVRTGDGRLRPEASDDRIHFTTLPWVSFTSFAHARKYDPKDSVPKIAFGKFAREGERLLLPISVEVHHALMDGLHVGRYLTRLEEALSEPEAYLAFP